MLLTFIAVKGQCSSCSLRWGGAKEDEDVTVKGHTAWKDTTTNGGNRWRTRQFPHAKFCNPSARTNIQVNTHIVIAARLRHVSPRSCCGVHEDQPRESTSTHTRVPGQLGAPQAHDSGRDCPGPGNGASLRIAATPAAVADGSRNAAIPEDGISTPPLRLRLRLQRNQTVRLRRAKPARRLSSLWLLPHLHHHPAWSRQAPCTPYSPLFSLSTNLPSRKRQRSPGPLLPGLALPRRVSATGSVIPVNSGISALSSTVVATMEHVE
jgi:hypothetical protein